MYHDLRELYWLEGIKKNIAEFVANYPNCTHVKVEHLKFVGLLQEIQVPTWKWKDMNIDFVVGLLALKSNVT